MAEGFTSVPASRGDAAENKARFPHPHSDLRAWLLVIAVAVIWWIAWHALLPLAEWLTYDLLGLSVGSRLGESVAFFLYDVPKILMLLTGMIFLVTTIRTFFSVEQTRALLGERRQGVGNVLAAMLGVVTPFCSCSAVPLFIGFVESGVPLGVTFSFLIAAPMVNEIALAMLFGLFGWQIAGLYMATGLTIAIIAGMVIGRFPNVESGVEEFVWQISVGQSTANSTRLSWHDRFGMGWQGTRAIVGKVWPFVIVGIAIGAGIHGFVPENALANILGEDAWWSVPAGVVLGIPLYANAAGIIPIVVALMEKGAAVGTTLAFMMSVVALSLPELIILRLVLKPRLIVSFVGVVGIGIVLTGYLFNIIIS